MTTAPYVPAPPPGPGVQPPFPAPPVEGRGKRIGMGLGIGALVLVLVCGGGMAALVGMLSSAEKALEEQAHAAVSDYLDALRDNRYDDAYASLCEQAQRRETRSEFRERVRAADRISSYRLGELDGAVILSVPVDVTYVGGDRADLDARLGQDSGTGELEVCELAG